MTFPEITIEVKYKGKKKTELKKLCSSKETYEVLKLLYDESSIHWQEEMILLCMNRANKVLGYYKVSKGGTTGTVCDPKMIFTTALQIAGTTSIILSHTHPSGNLTPSRPDEELTEKIKNAGRLLDIVLLDHVIVTDEGYYSFADEGKI